MAFGALRAAGFDLEPAARLVGASEKEARVLDRMIERGINAPLTSSLGRLFDAAAAVVLGRRVVDYEAQAAIELEGLACDESDRHYYKLELWEGKSLGMDVPLVLKTGNLWHALVDDLRRGVKKARIAARFHSAISEAFIAAVGNVRTATGLNQVALTGGCTHNRRLAQLLRTGLEEEGFEVFQHRRISPGDGGLSYGQAAVAAAVLATRGLGA
jgi:hydrogenase maturation protein HypF